MTGNTINDAQTAVGDNGAFLAGRYRVVRQLGQGGMGSVWLAEDTQLDNRPFAIKMLPSILVSNKRAYRQLKDEALVAMKLTHPNIVTLRAFEENGGNPFLVMDYIDGQTLDDYLADKGKLGEDEVIRVLRPIAAALDYAHGEGVVHRDVKPANVMIRKDGHPFILDFGIAREIQETLTRVTGKLSSGTLLYMSPEQLNGAQPKKEQDIYSFAAMAYECLKGDPPFVRGQIEHQILNVQPEPLNTTSSSPKIGEVAGGQRGMTIAASVMAGLAKKPEDRPKSCVAVLEDSNRVERAERVDGAGVAGTPRPPQENGGARRPAEPQRDDFSHKEEHKERKGSGIGKVLGILALLAALGGGGAWYYHQQQEAAARRAAARFAAAQRAREEAQRKAEADAARIVAEQRAREEAQRKAEEEAARIAAEQRAREEAQRKAEEEAARIAAAQRAREEAQRKAEEEAARIAAAQRAREEAQRKSVQKVQLWEGGPYWADRNIGAERPEDYGYHFWWGDTVGYKRVGDAWVASDGSSQNFSFCEANAPTCRKDDATLKREGWITDDGVLAPEHDAARTHWGGSWRMPTRQELMDLCNKCDWSWTTVNGVNGYVVRGKGAYASSSIFLPCVGFGLGTSLYFAGSYGYYCSSVPYSDYNSYYFGAWDLYFYSGGHYAYDNDRYGGRSVRPVQGFAK